MCACPTGPADDPGQREAEGGHGTPQGGGGREYIGGYKVSSCTHESRTKTPGEKERERKVLVLQTYMHYTVYLCVNVRVCLLKCICSAL